MSQTERETSQYFRDIMQELERTFPREFEITERNRFRHDDDMQFGFSYYYFLMSETTTKSTSEIFDEFDSDGSGYGNVGYGSGLN